MDWYDFEGPIQGGGVFGPDDERKRRRKRSGYGSIFYKAPEVLPPGMPPLERAPTPEPPARFHAQPDPAPVDDRIRMQPRQAAAVDRGQGPQQAAFSTPARVLKTELPSVPEPARQPMGAQAAVEQQQQSAMSRDEKGTFLKHETTQPAPPHSASPPHVWAGGLMRLRADVPERPPGWSEKVGFGPGRMDPKTEKPYQGEAAKIEESSRRGMGRGTWDPKIQPWMVTPVKPGAPAPDYRPLHERLSGTTANLTGDEPPAASQIEEHRRYIHEARRKRDAEIKEEKKIKLEADRRAERPGGLRASRRVGYGRMPPAGPPPPGRPPQAGPPPAGPVPEHAMPESARTQLRNARKSTIQQLHKQNRGLLGRLGTAAATATQLANQQAVIIRRGTEAMRVAGEAGQRERSAGQAREAELQQSVSYLQTRAGHLAAHGVAQVEHIQEQERQRGEERRNTALQLAEAQRQIDMGRTPRRLEAQSGPSHSRKHIKPFVQPKLQPATGWGKSYPVPEKRPQRLHKQESTRFEAQPEKKQPRLVKSTSAVSVPVPPKKPAPKRARSPVKAPAAPRRALARAPARAPAAAAGPIITVSAPGGGGASSSAGGAAAGTAAARAPDQQDCRRRETARGNREKG